MKEGGQGMEVIEKGGLMIEKEREMSLLISENSPDGMDVMKLLLR